MVHGSMLTPINLERILEIIESSLRNFENRVALAMRYSMNINVSGGPWSGGPWSGGQCVYYGYECRSVLEIQQISLYIIGYVILILRY